MRGRIRTVKPEVFSDEALGDLERQTGLPVFRVFVGLWCFADREGRFEWLPRSLRGAIAPCWDGDMEAVLEALASKSYIIRYTVSGKDYGYIRAFTKHQRVNQREAPSDLPDPSSHACTVMHVQESEAPTEESVGNETSGDETRGEREGTNFVAPAPADSAPTKSDERVHDDSLRVVREVFAEWQRVHSHDTAKLDAKRTARIRGALKLHAVDQLKLAIRGALKDDWLMGRDPRAPRKYDGLETILRDNAQIERLIDLERGIGSRTRRYGSAQPNLGKTGFESLEGHDES